MDYSNERTVILMHLGMGTDYLATQMVRSSLCFNKYRFQLSTLCGNLWGSKTGSYMPTWADVIRNWQLPVRTFTDGSLALLRKRFFQNGYSACDKIDGVSISCRSLRCTDSGIKVRKVLHIILNILGCVCVCMFGIYEMYSWDQTYLIRMDFKIHST